MWLFWVSTLYLLCRGTYIYMSFSSRLVFYSCCHIVFMYFFYSFIFNLIYLFLLYCNVSITIFYIYVLVGFLYCDMFYSSRCNCNVPNLTVQVHLLTHSVWHSHCPRCWLFISVVSAIERLFKLLYKNYNEV